jgi:hypothetical protein
MLECSVHVQICEPGVSTPALEAALTAPNTLLSLTAYARQRLTCAKSTAVVLFRTFTPGEQAQDTCVYPVRHSRSLTHACTSNCQGMLSDAAASYAAPTQTRGSRLEALCRETPAVRLRTRASGATCPLLRSSFGRVSPTTQTGSSLGRRGSLSRDVASVSSGTSRSRGWCSHDTRSHM